MTDVTRILQQMEHQDAQAATDLLPLVYDELRKLAAARLAQEKTCQTLQATALVHEAYLRLVDPEEAQPWNSRGHFFAAAAEAMRRILVETVRRKQTEKHGGDRSRLELNSLTLVGPVELEDPLVLSDAIDLLAAHDPQAPDLAKLRIFAGLSVDEAGAGPV